MNSKEIKEAQKNFYSNWEILSMVIQSGIEYPDAVWKVSKALNLDRDEREEMERDYDEIA